MKVDCFVFFFFVFFLMAVSPVSRSKYRSLNKIFAYPLTLSSHMIKSVKNNSMDLQTDMISLNLAEISRLI